jgi:hypothetical protein
MANGGSPLPAPRPAPSSLPAMPLPPKPRTGQTSHDKIPQPGQILRDHRQSTETLTSLASSSSSNASNQDPNPSPPRRPRRATRCSSPDPIIYSNNSSPQLSPKSHAPPPRPRQVLNQHHHHRHLSRGSPSPPPTRDLPALRPTYEALLEPRHSPQPLGQADQFEAITPDAEMILAGFYGLPYCVPVPDVLEQRSRAIAEAEEAEYRERKSWKQRARLSGRVEAALKGLALPGSSRSRSRNGRKF